MSPTDSTIRLLVRHSAAKEDIVLTEDVLRHLDVLKRFAGVDVWSDARIRAGDETRRGIERAIDGADLALLLLSVDFFASDFLQDFEVPRLLERHRTGKLRVVPVILRSCLWEVHPWLKELDPLPKDREPIASRQGDARDRALTELAREIVGLVSSKSVEPVSQQFGAMPTALLRARPRFEGPGGLPITSVPHFLGRDDELANLRAALARDQAVCVVATGLGGIGKTSIVRQFVATEAPRLFPDGSVWIDAMILDADAARTAERFGHRGGRRPTVAEAGAFLMQALVRGQARSRRDRQRGPCTRRRGHASHRRREQSHCPDIASRRVARVSGQIGGISGDWSLDRSRMPRILPQRRARICQIQR